MKLLRILVIVCLLAAGFAFLPDQPLVSAECFDESGNGDSDVWFGPFSMSAGTSLTATMTASAGGGTAIVLYIDGETVDVDVEYFTPHTYTIEFTEATHNVELLLDWEFNGRAENTYTVTSTDCGGCDTLIAIPPQAVSGAFTQDAELYWAPGQLVNPLTTIAAGNTYLVAGQDATGMYRQVLLVCTWVWVRADTVGPNYDAIWNGTPLPTDVVE